MNVLSRIEATRQQTMEFAMNRLRCVGFIKEFKGMFYCVYHSNLLVIIFVGETTYLNVIHLMGIKLVMELVLQYI